jgi:hypothetical protein
VRLGWIAGGRGCERTGGLGRPEVRGEASRIRLLDLGQAARLAPGSTGPTGAASCGARVGSIPRPLAVARRRPASSACAELATSETNSAAGPSSPLVVPRACSTSAGAASGIQPRAVSRSRPSGRPPADRDHARSAEGDSQGRLLTGRLAASSRHRRTLARPRKEPAAGSHSVALVLQMKFALTRPLLVVRLDTAVVVDTSSVPRVDVDR